MARDEKNGRESLPVDFPEPVTVAWDARDAFDDPERAARAWELARRTLGLDTEGRAQKSAPPAPNGHVPSER